METATSPLHRYLKENLYDNYKFINEGTVDPYENPECFGICLVTKSGQVFEEGNCNKLFTIKSISKPLVYGLALEDHGRDYVNTRVGVEPTREAFNSIILDEKTYRPYNPIVNTGAIATTDLIKGYRVIERLQRILDMFRRYTGREHEINVPVFLTEKVTGHSDRAMAHLMLSFGMISNRIEETLDLYFQQCSIMVNTHDLAMIAATLANGGVNPITKERAIDEHYVQDVISLMLTCGMYDYSGEWAYRVGIPAKSSLGGGITAVVSGRLGIGTFSPLLDAKGNSIRGIKVCEHLSIDFGLHISNAAKPKLILEDLIEGVNSAQRGTSLIGANLIGANLMGKDLTRENLVGAYLSGANLSEANLMGKDLSGANFIGANLIGTNLSGANLSGANLYKANLSGANLIGTNLSGANLIGTNLIAADFSGANLSGADLSGFDLSGVKVSGANLTGVNLTGVNLSGANLSGANLSGANLSKTQAIETDFTGAKFTGACLEDWNINSATKLNDIDCQYVYLRKDKQEPRPSSGKFAPGEFTKLFQKALETVDLIFADGIDWKAFFQSFQELRRQYDDENLSIQAIEKKSGGAFVIRLEVSAEADKVAIESKVKALYQTELQAIETQYLLKLQAQETLISKFERDLEYERQTNTNLLGVVKTMAEKEPTHKTTIHANNVGFVQSGSGTVSNFSQNIGQNFDEITKIISSLRDLAQEFPEAQREEALVHLDDLQEDISKPEKRKPERIKTRIIALLTVASTVAGGIAVATDFSNNALELAEKLKVPIVFSQPQQPTQQLPPSTLNQPSKHFNP
ncbi:MULTISPECIES: glutaminase A [Nostoc]|uniref:Glutaminase n=1 Tax=Nostoc paludosum FACHB-159 TaxID=2692908 RepID=A0ABR8KJ25_9NOSO|nr:MULTISPECIES: glutaminase A [Nostoc]MBD2682537.1 glutaminase A [Nostoc sp. FACHB-857]MBD2738869.1 glutaminase A [Nostoc paludosum FACHB-159]